MATSVARRAAAAVPGFTIAQAWRVPPPQRNTRVSSASEPVGRSPGCVSGTVLTLSAAPWLSGLQAEPAPPTVVPLPCEHAPAEQAASAEAQGPRQKPVKVSAGLQVEFCHNQAPAQLPGRCSVPRARLIARRSHASACNSTCCRRRRQSRLLATPCPPASLPPRRASTCTSAARCTFPPKMPRTCRKWSSSRRA